eukprot:1160450-Pelagomonas_calceolata.AAC.23
MVRSACVAQESIAGEYFTISASGVVHMCEDGTPAEFIPIGQWVREHSVFNIMKQVCMHAQEYSVSDIMEQRTVFPRGGILKTVKRLLERAAVISGSQGTGACALHLHR